MKFLHSADLHIGKYLDRHARWEEQAAVLDEIAALAETEAADLVLLAGDIYDAYVPPAQAERLFYAFLERLSAGGKRAVVLIAGNHDQPERLSAAAALAAHRGIYIVGLPGQTYPAQPAGDGVYLERDGIALHLRLANGESAVVAALPYLSEARTQELIFRDLSDEEAGRRDYQAALADALARMAAEFRPEAACLVLAHLFVAGGESSESERPLAGAAQVGGSFGVPRSIFPPQADYIALGHLHRPQRIGADNCRYAGSPLAYSFSEADQTKSVVVGEIRMENGEKTCSLRVIPLNSGRPLTVWRADGYTQALSWCEDESTRQNWVNLYIELEQPLSSEQLDTLQAAHPHLVAVNPVYRGLQAEAVRAEQVARLSILERFALFAAAAEGVEPDEALLKAFVALTEEEQEGDLS